MREGPPPASAYKQLRVLILADKNGEQAVDERVAVDNERLDQLYALCGLFIYVQIGLIGACAALAWGVFIR